MSNAVKWVLGGLALLALLGTLRSCYYAGQVRQVLTTGHPLPRRTVRALTRQAAADSALAAGYTQAAGVATRQAAITRQQYHTALYHADSLHARSRTLSGPRAGTLAAAVRRVANFTLADTAR